MRVALVNTNRMKPPIAPIGLDYVAEALSAAGHEVEVLDLCWAEDVEATVAEFFTENHYDLVGLSLRNTDDCTYASRQSFLGEYAEMVGVLRRHTDSRLVMGGVGFSVMPEKVLEFCGLDVGVWGAGEFALVELANRIHSGRDWRDAPNLVFGNSGGYRRNPPSTRPLGGLPPMRRRWIDNKRYFREGGQAGIETKRGCPHHCIFCADPQAKGRAVRVRPPAAVGEEIASLLEQGIDHLHTCDSEFNVSERHVIEVCEEILRRGLSERVRWYAYCAPLPFSPKLARLMRRAGCVGIDFGADNGDAEMLKRLRRDYTPEDILSAARASREAGMAVMLDLLFGGPGESRESLVRTVELVRRAEPDRVGTSVGVRVYEGTELARLVTQPGLKEGLVGRGDPMDPLFFLEPKVAPFIFQLLDEMVGADERFFFTDPTRPDRNYNYNANQRLIEAIKKGHRGAYWDILRQCK